LQGLWESSILFSSTIGSYKDKYKLIDKKFRIKHLNLGV